MRLFPYEKINIQATKSQKEIMRIFWSHTDLERHLPFLGSRETKFYGTVNDDHFKIKYSIFYRNPFNPIIEGQVKQKGMGSCIDITIRLQKFVKVIMIGWFLFCMLYLVIKILSVPFSFEDILPPLLMLGVGFVFMQIGYRFKAWKCKSQLYEMLKNT